MDAPKTLQEAIIYFADVENCRQYMVNLRWSDGVVRCPHCDSENVDWLPNAKLYKCYEKHAKQKFSLKVGTIFEESPISLEKWLPCVWLITNAKNGISSWELHRSLGVTQKTAWFMLHRVRLAMQDPNAPKLAGEVEADESYFGGKAEFMHLDKRTRMKMAGKLDRGGYGKAIVMGLLDRNTKQARVKVVKTTRKTELRGTIQEHVEAGSTIYSDALKSYRGLPLDGFAHEFIDHAEAYVEGAVHTNGLENFWSLMKRSLKGTYVSVEPFHLQAYADEQAFRFNNRKDMNDADRFAQAMRQIVGKRITYAELTGKEAETPLG
ncbi:MAG: IS1595 family transposase [Acidobacteriota bacterium]